MDSATVLAIVYAVGGATLLKVVEKIFGNNKVKELGDIIQKMRSELDEAYSRIGKLEQANKSRLGVEERNVILEVSIAQCVACESHKICPVKLKFDELTSEMK